VLDVRAERAKLRPFRPTRFALIFALFVAATTFWGVIETIRPCLIGTHGER
jgi:hypothetical protein